MRPDSIGGRSRGSAFLLLAPLLLMTVVDCWTIIDLPSLVNLDINWKVAIPYYDDWVAERKEFDALQANHTPAFQPKEPECLMTVPQLIAHLGFPVEVHHVTTKDGYILELHRIPRGRNADPTTAPGQPVYLQHGIGATSADFANNLANESLGYVLADNGYDVWLGNSRGNTYSTNHTTLSTTSQEFWDFSYDEIAEFDVTATIDYVLASTSKSQLTYIGHSQGTTVGFALFSSTHDYDSKVKRFIALAPVTTLTHLNCVPCAALSPSADALHAALTTAKIYNLLDNSDFTKFIGNTVCAGPVINELCVGFFEALFGKEGPQFNKTRLPVYFGQYPGGTSVKSLVHFGQNHNRNSFSHFDYGLLGNLAEYGWITPPVYKLKNVKVPTAMIYGSADLLAVPEDVRTAWAQLPNKISKHEVADYSHVDIVWSTAPVLPVIEKVLALLALP